MNHSDLAARLARGLNGDPDQRAATHLLVTGGRGVWSAKLAGWDQYLVPTNDPLRPDALYVDWHQLRADLAADDTARDQYAAWADSSNGRHATDDQRERMWGQLVPARPWHGASSTELLLLRIAVELAPGGLLGHTIPRLDDFNRRALTEAIRTLLDGQFLPPGPPAPGEPLAADRTASAQNGPATDPPGRSAR